MNAKLKKLSLTFFLILMGTAPLAACSASCDCPHCPNTTVVTPDHSTVIEPRD